MLLDAAAGGAVGANLARMLVSWVKASSPVSAMIQVRTAFGEDGLGLPVVGEHGSDHAAVGLARERVATVRGGKEAMIPEPDLTAQARLGPG